MSVLGPAPKKVDPEERRLIDEAISAGKVTKCPPCTLANRKDFVYDDQIGKIKTLNPDAKEMRFWGAGQQRAKIAYDRRKKVKKLVAEGKTQKQIAEMFGVHVMTIRQDVKVLRGQANESD